MALPPYDSVRHDSVHHGGAVPPPLRHYQTQAAILGNME